MKLYLHHLHSLEYCNRGIRAFCNIHGLDYTKLLDEGLPLEALEKVDDFHVQEALRLVKREAL